MDFVRCCACVGQRGEFILDEALKMIAYSISEDKKSILIENSKILFEDEINNVLVFPNVCVVHLTNIKCASGKSSVNMWEQPINNIYGIDSSGKILWNIKQITMSHLGEQIDDYYSGAAKLSNNILRVATFRGITLDIDINSLDVVSKTFTR